MIYVPGNISRQWYLSGALLLLVAIFASNSFAGNITKHANQINKQSIESLKIFGVRRALSLKVLQQQLRACSSRKNCSNKVKYMGGMTYIAGYLLDRANQDIILLGRADEGSPRLHTDDFILTLQNSWYRYAKRSGHTVYYRDIGCTIDPQPSVLKKLQSVGAKLSKARSQQATAKQLQAWNQICRLPQRVKVFGIPNDTRLSKIIVNADYLLKKIVDGSVPSRVKAVPSLLAMTKLNVRQQLNRNDGVAIDLDSMNRFWLASGSNQFSYYRNIVFLKKSPIILKTESERLRRDGKRIKSTGKVNRLASKFAANFSKHYEQISRQHKIYKDLNNVFRFAAISKALKNKKAFEKADFSGTYILKKYQPQKVAVARQLPGHAHIGNLKVTKRIANGTSVITVKLPSCGGVDMGMRIRAKNFKIDTTGSLKRVKTRAISNRPTGNSLWWFI